MKFDIQIVRDIDRIQEYDEKVLAAAVFYTELGFYIIPVQKRGKAIPKKSHGVSYAQATNKPETAKKWYGSGGSFRGWNIGLACGRHNGFFALDFDVREETNGKEEFEKICPEGFVYPGPVQMSPNGGMHYIFRWRENCANSVQKLGPCIDTRGGEANVCGGHIVAWPSVIDTGKTYKWISGGFVEQCPDFIADKMGESWRRKSSGPGRGNEGVEEDDLENKFTPDQIEQMVSYIDPDIGYDEWCRIGMAIHSQLPNQRGAQIFTEWSRKGVKYKGECVSKWSSFNEGGQVRVGTLIHHAKQAGFDLKSLDVSPEVKDRIDSLVHQMNERFAVVPMGSDVFIIEERNVPPQLARIEPKYRILKRTGFKALLENATEVVVNNNGKAVKKTHADIWLAHEERREFPGGVGMFPGEPRRYQGYFNLWDGLTVDPKPGDWGLFKRHIYEVVCSHDKNLFEWVLDWMADLYQDPANPKGTAIIMSGVEGCGKGTFAQIMGRAFGHAFKHVTDEEHFIGKFNGHLMDCVLLFADEVTYGGNKKVAGKIKALVTEEYTVAERKGVDAIVFKNCAHLLIASNEKWFIPAGPQSRRWLVLEFSAEKANDVEWFSNIHDQMYQGGGLEAMIHELMNREIKSNLKKAPETEALNAQRSQLSATDPVVEWWQSQVAKHRINVPSARKDGPTDWPEIIRKADALDAFERWANERNRRVPSADRFWKECSKFGLETIRVTIDGKRPWVFRVPTYSQAIQYLLDNYGINLRTMQDENYTDN